MAAMPRRPLVALLAAALGLPGCVADTSSGRTQIVTALYPLTMVAARIGSDRVDVVDVTTGAEPHDLELTPVQAGLVERAEVVLLVRGLQPALDAATGADARLDALAVVGGEDPHVWLDPVLMADIARAVADRLSRVDPDGAESYAANADAIVREMTVLHDQATVALSGCRRRDIVTSHAAFGRFAQRYGLRQTAITGVDPEAEPSPARIAEVVAFAEANGVTTVFAESADDKTAQTVAREAGAAVAVLDPAEVDRGADYVTVMRRNVTALRAALDCP